MGLVIKSFYIVNILFLFDYLYGGVAKVLKKKISIIVLLIYLFSLTNSLPCTG